MPRSYLVVDRSLTVTRQTRHLLEAEGADPAHVHEAHNAQDALGLYHEHHPDVVILGLGLPDMGGHEVAKHIWEDDPEADIVVLTVLKPKDQRVRDLLEEGAWDIVRKPLRANDVHDLVQELERREPGSQRIQATG